MVLVVLAERGETAALPLSALAGVVASALAVDSVFVGVAGGLVAGVSGSLVTGASGFSTAGVSESLVAGASDSLAAGASDSLGAGVSDSLAGASFVSAGLPPLPWTFSRRDC